MARFYDVVDIEVKFVKYTGIRLYIEYIVRDRESGEVRCTGKSEHCFIDESGKIISLKRSYPEIHETMMQYISDTES
jgi:acyl-CoA thioester hydrolase